MRYVFYLRCSTDEQKESGHGILSQKDQCQSYVDRSGGEIAGIFSDEGISGAAPIEKRPGLASALAELRKGDVLLVASRSRLGRDPIMVGLTEAVITSKGCRVISTADEGTMGTDCFAVFHRRLADALSELERGQIRSRTKLSLLAKKQRNERVGHIPYGSRLASDGIHLEPDPAEREILSIIRELRQQGMSLRKVAEELTRRNQQNRGRPWSPVNVFRVSKGKAA